ncbi:MAG: methyltransferase domain-containing protein [Rhodobacteraceae bacterium]|nr:methyltransferase domain-containing protein [Paracoccaceae bacterium]
MENGWEASAEAWLQELGESGDFARRAVLDAPMMARVRAARPSRALDIGCGEGRFCRMMAAEGIVATGLDPTERLLAEARARHPEGHYVCGRAEALPFPDAGFELVVSYLSLIDIDDTEQAVAEMVRVLQPGGRLLVANLSGIASAGVAPGWAETVDGRSGWLIDRYFEARADWVEWRGVRIRNWHRPLADYMAAFLRHGLNLRHFEEPRPAEETDAKSTRYRRIPMFVILEWQKP